MDNVKLKVLAIVEESMLALATGVLKEEDRWKEYNALYELKEALLQIEDYEILIKFRDLEVKYDVTILAHENI